MGLSEPSDDAVTPVVELPLQLTPSRDGLARPKLQIHEQNNIVLGHCILGDGGGISQHWMMKQETYSEGRPAIWFAWDRRVARSLDPTQALTTRAKVTRAEVDWPHSEGRQGRGDEVTETNSNGLGRKGDSGGSETQTMEKQNKGVWPHWAWDTLSCLSWVTSPPGWQPPPAQDSLSQIKKC